MIVILGASGMLGHAVHRVLHDCGFDTVGAVRGHVPDYPRTLGLKFRANVDISDLGALQQMVSQLRPSVVINAAGVIKQRDEATNVRAMFDTNAVAPRQLSILGAQTGFRIIQVSTDCVFSGLRGSYTESDVPDATDAYGRSKFLGELTEQHCLTLRTSIVGRGLVPNPSLVDWFLAQTGSVRGFRRAIFSGLPANEIGQVIADHLVDGNAGPSGLRHLSADPISKHELLCLVRHAWQRNDIDIVADDQLAIDRSLNSERFRAETGFRPDPWP